MVVVVVVMGGDLDVARELLVTIVRLVYYLHTILLFCHAEKITIFVENLTSRMRVVCDLHTILITGMLENSQFCDYW